MAIARSPHSYNDRQMEIETLAIVGVGLIGASVGAAAKSYGVARRVIGVDTNKDHLRIARENHAIDDCADSLESADFIAVCVPVDRIASCIVDAARGANPNVVITDAGSTKGGIVSAVKRHAVNRFVGSHPMAGSEKKGPAYARNDLFLDRPVILTPDESTDPQALTIVETFWRHLGGRVLTMSPAEHDQAVAAVSHLPHAVAAALAGQTDPKLIPLSAGGFRDTTRVAAAGPGIWMPIFRENREAVLLALDHFSDHLARFRELLVADDGPGLSAWLADAKRVRDVLGS
jgi:cyclohexadieny/prephenate dehydrogenase